MNCKLLIQHREFETNEMILTRYFGMSKFMAEKTKFVVMSRIIEMARAALQMSNRTIEMARAALLMLNWTIEMARAALHVSNRIIEMGRAELHASNRLIKMARAVLHGQNRCIDFRNTNLYKFGFSKSINRFLNRKPRQIGMTQ